jgi:Rad4 beta-hairpin domain 3
MIRLDVTLLQTCSVLDQNGILDAAQRDLDQVVQRGLNRRSGWVKRRQARIDLIRSELFGPDPEHTGSLLELATNRHGNIVVSSMPPGLVHIQGLNIGSTRRALTIDYRRAMTGFNSSHWPEFFGVVVAAADAERLRSGLARREAKTERGKARNQARSSVLDKSNRDSEAAWACEEYESYREEIDSIRAKLAAERTPGEANLLTEMGRLKLNDFIDDPRGIEKELRAIYLDPLNEAIDARQDQIDSRYKRIRRTAMRAERDRPGRTGRFDVNRFYAEYDAANRDQLERELCLARIAAHEECKVPYEISNLDKRPIVVEVKLF